MLQLQQAKDNRSKKINKIEALKELKKPIEVYNRLDEIAKLGWDNLSKEDSAFFLKCFGYFIKDGDFMLRVRVPGGQLNSIQANKIGEVARDYGDNYIDLTTRMQVELRYIDIKDIAIVVKELESVGLTTFQTGVDNLRNIVTDPLDGYAHDNIINSFSLIKKMQSVFLKNDEYIGTLPRKFNTAILGSLSNSCNIYGHDCSFVLAQKDGVWGFNIELGGKVGEQTRSANAFVLEDEVVDIFEAIVDTFKKYGYRDNRNKNRLFFLLNDVGVDNFMDEVYTITDIKPREAGVTMVSSKVLNYATNRVLCRDGKFACKIVVPSGIFSGTDMIEASKTAQELGDGNLRISYDQNLWILGVENLKSFEESKIGLKYSKYENIYFNDMIACAGTATCSFGVIPNKPDAIEMSHYLNKEVKLYDSVIRINWSACPKGCGVHGIADIGLEGCKAKDEEGNRVDGVHLLIGGKITKEAREGYFLHKSLPITEAKIHIKYLLLAFKDYKKVNESFEDFEDRYLKQFSKGALAFFTKINYILEKSGLPSFELPKEPKTYKYEELEVFEFGLKLYKLLTNENRFEGTVGLDIIENRPKAIKEDSVSKLNSKVPLNISKAIYAMTHEDKAKRAKVFTEIFTILKK